MNLKPDNLKSPLNCAIIATLIIGFFFFFLLNRNRKLPNAKIVIVDPEQF